MDNTNSLDDTDNQQDFTCQVIPVERRKQRRKKEYKNEREDGKLVVTETTVDFFIKHLEQKMSQQREDIRFTHNKKFIILGSTFTVLTLISTFIMGLVDTYKPEMSAIVIGSIGVFLALFLLIVSVVNVSIIKYLVDLKLTHIIAIRGLNCNRQSLHTLLFAKLEGKLPKKLPRIENKETEFPGTILDKTTKFWEIYGRHEKYPLNNVELRDRYLEKISKDGEKIIIPKKNIWFKSSDLFPIYVIAIFTLVIIISPIVVFLIEVGTWHLPPYISMLIGACVILWGIAFLRMVKTIVNGALEKIISKLSSDETFKFEKYQVDA